MKVEDKIEILIKDFKKKFGTNPTCVLLPEVEQNKVLGLLVKQGNRLAVGVGNRLLFWDTAPEFKKLPLFVQNEPEDVFKLIKSYNGINLTEILNAIADFEQIERTRPC